MVFSLEAPILQGINVTFRGEPTAIIGQNGAGKTTFVKLLKALLKPSSGDIIINGKNIKNTTAAKIASTVGLVFQNPNDQIFKNNVLDEVLFGPLNIGQAPEVARANAEIMLDLVGLLDKAGENPYDLSLAERKMIAVASILAMDTDIVIFDEPTMGQDARGKKKLKEIIRELYAQGKLVLCILHDMDFVAETFGRTVIFSNGKLLYDGPTRQAFAGQAILDTARVEQPHLTQLACKMGYDGVLLKLEELIKR
nr:ABC transporter ATP-binding protein [Sporosarcina limicola]